MDDFSTYQAPAAPTRRPLGGGIPIIIVLIITLVVGAVGGTAGFVVLANSDSSWARSLRKVLHVDDISDLTLPSGKQTVRLEESSAVIDAASKVSPAVVSISAMQQVQDFYGRVSTQEVAGGSGFILTS